MELGDWIRMLGGYHYFSLTHNPHKLYYETVHDHVLNAMDDCWVSEDSHRRAEETDELWDLRIYPVTPIGFEQYYANTLEELVAATS